MRRLARTTAPVFILALTLGFAAAQTPPAEIPPQPAPETAEPSPRETAPITLARVTEMLRSGMKSPAVIARLKLSGSTFDLTIEDVIRLNRLGASPGLIVAMTRGETPAAPPVGEPAGAARVPAAPVPAAGGTAAPSAPAPGSSALTYRKIMKMYRKGVSPDVIAADIARNGLKEPVELDQLLALGAEDGFPDNLLLAMAAGARPAASPTTAAAAAATAKGPEPAGQAAQPPLKTTDIMGMLEQKKPQADIIAAIQTRGIAAPPSLTQAIEMRKLGATDPVIDAINTAAQDLADSSEEDLPEEPVETTAEAAGPPGALPPAPDADTVTVLSHPAGARVYLSPARTRSEERFRHDFLVGRTPVSVTVPPGDYTLIVEKKAGTFEAGLLPAWRTMHDPPGIRSLLDETDLTFDPKKCCLPGSVTGVVDLRPIPEDQPRAIIGDQFDGLSPFLFDGETLQILRVRHSEITDVMKLYQLRKTAGQARAVIALFVPAEGDPLDLGQDTAAGTGSSFDAELRQPRLQYLVDDAGQEGLASALGVETDHLAKAIDVLSKVGKVILHQQVPGGVRLVTLAIDYNGSLRVTDQTILPENPFATVPVKKGKRKKTPPAPPPIPPLPALERVVVPGLGSPRLSIVNPGPAPVALILDDGEFCFAPAGVTSECILEPGTHQVRVMSGGEQRGGGALHLSYHARTTMKMPPMSVQ